MADTASKVASTVAEKSKDIATTIGEKTQDAVGTGKLKLKTYNLNRDVSHKFTDLGGRAFELLKDNGKNVYEDADVTRYLQEIQNLESEIQAVEEEMEQVKTANPGQE